MCYPLRFSLIIKGIFKMFISYYKVHHDIILLLIIIYENKYAKLGELCKIMTKHCDSGIRIR